MITNPPVRAAPLQKERVKIMLDFGRHQYADDARSLESAFESFCPAVYVPEKAGLGKEGRLEMTALLNSLLRTEGGAEKLMDQAERHSSYDMHPFAREEMRLVGKNRPAGIYLAEEGAEMDDWSLAWMMMAYAKFSYDAMCLLIGGEAEAAIRMAESGVREFAKTALIERNEIVVEGMERFLVEGPWMFPGLPESGDIRVLMRYGTTHLALKEMLESRGFAADVWNVPRMDFSADTLVRLSRDFQTPLTHDEGMRLLFANLFNEATSAGEESEPGEEAVAASMAETYSKIGGEGGFLKMLSSASISMPDKKQCIESAKRTLAIMAGVCKGGSNG